MELQSIFEWLQISALALMCLLLLTGHIIPRFVVERFMLPPLISRIEALEQALGKREAELQDLVRQQAAALGATGRALERALERGG